MRNKTGISLMLFFSCLLFSKAAHVQLICDSVFVKEYVGPGHIEPFATKYLPDHGMLVAGRASLTAAGNRQLMATKLSSTGTILWSYLFGGNDQDSLLGIVLLSDNTFLLYGTTSSFGYANGKPLLIHIDAAGTVLWSRQIGDASASKDRLKVLRQANDGDIIGTFNINDSTNLSDPVVFKMGLDGTLKWARRFDNLGDDSFTSIASENNKVYVSGYFTDTKKRAVLSTLNISDGSHISSQKLYYADTSYQQELIDMEVYSGKISYGLWAQKQVGTTLLTYMMLIQADLSGTRTFETIVSLLDATVRSSIRRSMDNGFFVLNPLGGSSPTIVKLSSLNLIEWSTLQSNLPYYFNQKNNGFDITNANGTVSAGYYKNFSTANLNRMVLTKTGETGIAGPCTQPGFTFFVDTVTLREASFSWGSSAAVSIGLNQLQPLSNTPLPITANNLCDTTYCTDITPLPPACNKTSLVEYEGVYTSLLRDGVTLSDGSKIVVGEHRYAGFIMKLGNNGDVIWSRKYDEFDHTTIFLRVIKADGDNVFVFANTYYVINHGAFQNARVMKLDANGNILFTKETQRGQYEEVADVFSLPGGGFVMMINEYHGLGYLYSDVIRFDANLNVIWKKEIKHFSAAPIYRSIYCTADAVYIGHDSYDYYNQNKVGIQKLDLTTGNDKWSKGFTLDGNTLRFDKLFVQGDTVYAFIKKLLQIDFSNYDYHLVMLKLTSAGNIINSVLLNCDNMVWPSSYYYIDYGSPTVTFTQDDNFVMGNQVKTPGGNALNITRFDKDGNGLWSRNYAQLNKHHVFNIHTQDSGVFIMGTVDKPRTGYPSFKANFILKADNQGKIIQTATGTCLPEDRPFSKTPITVNEVDSRVDSVVNLNSFSVTPATMAYTDIFYDATLYCNQVAYCSTMDMEGDSSSCSLQDTLVYHITNNNCGAATRWIYDTTMFSLVSRTGDSLKLYPLKAGASVIKAEIESPCFTITKTIPVSVLISASQLHLGIDTTICPGDTILLNAGAGFNSYTWNNGNTDSTLVVTTAGTYYVAVTDFCGGFAIDTIYVSGINSIFDLTGPPALCKNDTIILTATPGFTQYQWSPNTNISSSHNTANVHPAQTTLYHVQAATVSGCIVEDSLLITVNTSPPISIGKDTTLCYDQSIQLSAPAGFSTYQWSNGDQTASTLVQTAGTYSIAGVYSNGCISRDTIIIAKYIFIKPSLGTDRSVCNNYQLSAGNYQNYLWSDLSSGNSLLINQPAAYWVEVTDANGCRGKDTVIITGINADPSGFLKPADSICKYETLVISSLNNYVSYSWSTWSSQMAITIDKAGSYTLAVRDANGCKGKDTIQVFEKNCITGVRIPTAFTPNGDQLNDLFRARVYGIAERFLLQVYDRWGNLVFSTTEPGIGWDGKVKGIVAGTNVFVWYCTYKLQGEEQGFQKGTVTLIR